MIDLRGRWLLWAQNVFCSVPQNLDLVKYRPLKLKMVLPYSERNHQGMYSSLSLR